MNESLEAGLNHSITQRIAATIILTVCLSGCFSGGSGELPIPPIDETDRSPIEPRYAPVYRDARAAVLGLLKDGKAEDVSPKAWVFTDAGPIDGRFLMKTHGKLRVTSADGKVSDHEWRAVMESWPDRDGADPLLIFFDQKEAFCAKEFESRINAYPLK